MEIEILAHVSSALKRSNDEQHRRQLLRYLSFEPARVHSVTRKEMEWCDEKNKTMCVEASEMFEKVPTFKNNPSREIELKKSFSDALEPGPKSRIAGLKRSFSDIIGVSSSKSMPQSSMKLLELASTQWKRLKGIPSEELVDPKLEIVPNSTDSQLEDTQLALSSLCDDLGVRFQSSDGLEPMASGYLEVSNGSQPFRDVPNNNNGVDKGIGADISWMPSELSTFEVNGSKPNAGSRMTPNPSECQGNSLVRFESPIIPSDLSSFDPSASKSNIVTPQSAFPEARDQENGFPDSLSVSTTSKSPIVLILRLAKLPMRVDSPPVNSEYLKVEGIPGSFVTRTLQSLTSSAELISKWHPEQQLRVPGKWERGYWLFDTSKWSIHDQITFWTFIVNRIRKGQAGLGTWAARNVGKYGIQPEEPGKQTELGVLRIYCWGAIAKDVYILCWLAFKGVEGVESKWVSAVTGEDVIFMI